MARLRPYTSEGIRRVPCARCGQPSHQQWQICADGNHYRGFCSACDVELNALVLRFVWGETREADIAKYAERRMA